MQPTAPPSSPDTDEPVMWPYSRRVYLGRLVWAVVQLTVWPLCWWRVRGLRAAVLRMMGGTVGRSVDITGGVKITLPWELSIADHVTIGARVQLYNLGGLAIGRHTTISQDVYVCGGTHDYTKLAFPLVRKKIVIGDHVWVAAGAFIGPGVTIGDGAVVGARAVVVKDVEPWTIVAGNPATFVKARAASWRAATPTPVAPPSETAAVTDVIPEAARLD